MGSVGWHRDKQNIIATLEFVKELAQRYGKREVLQGIELLNEPSGRIPKRILREYYVAAYKIIRAICGDKVWVVYNDAFRPRRWRSLMHGKSFTGVYIDSHQYQLFTPRDQRRSIHRHLSRTMGTVRRRLRMVQKYHPAIIGEWSLALHPDSLRGLNESQMAAARATYGSVQRFVYGDAAAWYYWTYKTEDKGPWNFRAAIEQGWILPL